MKNKFIVSFTIVSFSILSFISLSSLQNGLVGQTTQGCFCHSMLNDSATIRLLNLPSNGFVAGQTYSLDVEVENSAFIQTANRGGFNIGATSGTLQVGTGTGTRLDVGELTHTTPATLVNGKAVWTIDWQAPTNIDSVKFNIAGVIANGNNKADGDVEGIKSFILKKAQPTGIIDHKRNLLRIAPNPSNAYIDIAINKGIWQAQIAIYSLSGCVQKFDHEWINQNTARVNTSQLANGLYFIQIQNGSELRQANFIVKH